MTLQQWQAKIDQVCAPYRRRVDAAWKKFLDAQHIITEQCWRHWDATKREMPAWATEQLVAGREPLRAALTADLTAIDEWWTASGGNARVQAIVDERNAALGI